jgi:predicted nucleotidyltransferase
MPPRIAIPGDRLAEFCRQWGIIELALFGSVLRDDFDDRSDVDVLLTFAPGSFHGIDEYIEMRDELEAMFGRRVDVVNRGSLRNPFLKHHVLTSRRVISMCRS